jgi:hypothetical protein
MSRTDKLWRSLLVSLALTAGCNQGGTFDPLDNLGAGNGTPPPTGVTAVLPDCSATTAAPCKIAFTDLSFTEDGSCAYKSDTMLGKTWNNPNDDKAHLQFGASETSALSSCEEYAHKQCDMTLSAVPALFSTFSASKIRLTFSEKHKLFLKFLTSGTTVNGAAVATGVLHIGGQDVLTLAGQRNDGSGNPELSPVTAWVAPSADRSIGLRIVTDCGQVFSANLPIFWSVEGMVAEMLP